MSNVSPFKERLCALELWFFMQGGRLHFWVAGGKILADKSKKMRFFVHIVGTQIMVCPVIVIVGMYRLFNAYAILLVAVGIGAFLKKNTVKERGVP